MIKAGAELGFSPVSRTRVQIDGLSGPLAWLCDRNSDPDGLLPTPWDFDRAGRA
jgi:hypothetical protein